MILIDVFVIANRTLFQQEFRSLIIKTNNFVAFLNTKLTFVLITTSYF